MNEYHKNPYLLLKTPQQINLDKEEIIKPLENKHDVSAVKRMITRDQRQSKHDPFARNKEIAKQMAMESKADQDYVNNEINNTMSPQAQQQFAEERNQAPSNETSAMQQD